MHVELELGQGARVGGDDPHPQPVVVSGVGRGDGNDPVLVLGPEPTGQVGGERGWCFERLAVLLPVLERGMFGTAVLEVDCRCIGMGRSSSDCSDRW